MTVRQLIVLGVALLAAIGALVFVQGVARSRPAPQEAASLAPSGPRVLVAAREIAAGSKIVAGDLEWRPWAAEAVADSFVTDTAASDADTRFVEEGRIARQALAAGEPVVEARMIKPGQQGFMAAMLLPGYRAVAVPVSEETAAAGFILPNDRVDVIVTRKMTLLGAGSTENNEVTRSGVVLSDVRVLAIDQTYRAAEGEDPEAIKGSVALLELSPRDTELVAMADQLGDLSLALRPIDASMQADRSSSQSHQDILDQMMSSGSAVKVHSFGSVRSVSAPPGGQ
jgi:pilus assembly protein CpaB